jgi:hypothetical protein
MATLPKETPAAVDLSGLGYEVIKAELEKRKGERIAALKQSIKANQILVEMETIELCELTGEPLPPLPKTRKGKGGRKPGTAKKGKRGKVGESILKFLSTKGKEGAHISAIAEHVGAKTGNVTAWFYSTGKKLTKKVKPATFALK